MTAEAQRDPDFKIGVDLSGAVSDSEAAVAETPVAEHHSQVCANSGQLLTGYRCKLICAGCGYYMSCADYY
jgi:hypothetical protein